jgi:hypothetical protein
MGRYKTVEEMTEELEQKDHRLRQLEAIFRNMCDTLENDPSEETVRLYVQSSRDSYWKKEIH